MKTCFIIRKKVAVGSTCRWTLLFFPVAKATAVFQMIQAERSLHLKKLETGDARMVEFGKMSMHRSCVTNLGFGQ